MLVSWDSICCYVRVIFFDFGHLEFKSSMFFRTFFQQSKSGRPNFSIWKIWEDLYIPVWVSSRISGGLTMVNPPKEGWIYIKFHVNYSTQCASQIPSDTIEIRPALDSFGRGVGTWSLCRRGPWWWRIGLHQPEETSSYTNLPYIYIWATVKTPAILNMYSTDIGLWKLMEIVKNTR